MIAGCEENGHERGQCKNQPAVTIWKGRVEWYCLTCREYEYGGDKGQSGAGDFITSRPDEQAEMTARR